MENRGVFKVKVPHIGHAQAIVYDIRAWRKCFRYVRFYLKQCEKTMVRFADLIVCDSLHLVFDVCFNREVAGDAALY